MKQNLVMLNRYWAFSIIFMFILSIFLQTQMYQDHDLLFALEGGKRLLAGGTYVNDMFDNNPPLIFYFSLLINIVANLCSMPGVFVFKLVIYLSIVYSLCMCYCLLNCTQKKQTIPILLLVMLAFCLLILPVNCFGEREHLMIALVMPYFVLLYQRASGMTFSKTIKITISLLAAFGFALKPYFLFSLIFAELLIAYWKTDAKIRLFRLETRIIIAIIILYLMSIAIFMPSYYHDVLPLVLDFYAFNSRGMLVVLSNTALLNTVLLGFSFLFIAKKHVHDRKFWLDKFLIAITLGFALSYILQGKGWYYHALPLITMNALLATLLIYRLFFMLNDRLRYLVIFTIIVSAQILLLLTPTFFAYRTSVLCYHNKACGYPTLIKVAREYAENKPVFFFSTLMSYTIPIVYYSETTLASRFPTMWLLSGILNREYTLKHGDKRCLDAKNKVRTYLIDDFKRYQPALVFVDISPHKAYIKPPFDYLAFMQQSAQFVSIWAQYRYLMTSNNYAIYKRLPRSTDGQ